MSVADFSVLGLTGLSMSAYAGALVTVFAAAVVQRITGAGFGTLAAAYITLIAPERTLGTVLLLGATITVWGVLAEYRAVRLREIAPALAGRVIGAVPAVIILAAVPGTEVVMVGVALAILFGVALSFSGLRWAITPRTLLVAGTLSGFSATLTSVGAAPMSLLYQRETAARMRPTLNAFFLLGLLISLVAVASQGRVTPADLALTGALLPAIWVGAAVGPRIGARIADARVRLIVLALAGFAAIVLLAKAIFGA